MKPALLVPDGTQGAGIGYDNRTVIMVHMNRFRLDALLGNSTCPSKLSPIIVMSKYIYPKSLNKYIYKFTHLNNVRIH